MHILLCRCCTILHFSPCSSTDTLSCTPLPLTSYNTYRIIFQRLAFISPPTREIELPQRYNKNVKSHHNIS